MSKTALFQLETINSGEFLDVINTQLHDMANDVRDRPYVEKERKVTVTVTIKPKWDAMSGINMPEIECRVTPSFPGYKTLAGKGFFKNNELLIQQDEVEQTLFDSENIKQLKGEV